MLGNCKNNKWCCFCANWFDPGCTAIKPRQGQLFDVDTTKKARCMLVSYETKALSTCPKFKPKF